MEILLIRHGDPDYENDCLTPKGRQEARQLAEALDGVALDDIYVSPKGRAKETCQFMLDRRGMQATELDWIRETCANREGDPCFWQRSGEFFLRSGVEITQSNCLHPDGALPEAKGHVERTQREFGLLMATYGYVREGALFRVEASSTRRIALFCHIGFILTLLSDLLHWPLPLIYVCAHIDPTGVTHLQTVEDNGYANLRAICINDRSHLRAAKLTDFGTKR